MADLLTPEDFLPWEGRTVRVNTIPEPINLLLARVERLPWLALHREPFALYFEAPTSMYLIDGTYEFDCGRGGPHAMHITQIMPHPDRRRYQAVFS